MIKETVTYTDYNGMERTEDFYFNMNKVELMKMEFGSAGGFAAMVKRAIASNESAVLLDVFEKLVRDAYGVKSPDGKRFIKSKELTDEFVQSPAYETIYMKMVMDDVAAARFINGIMPKDIQEEAAKDPEVQKLLNSTT